MFATIAARTEFLPTDLALDPSNSWVFNNAGPIFLGLYIVGVFSLMHLAMKGKEGWGLQISRGIIAPITVVTLVSLFAMIIHCQVTSNDRKETKIELADQNRDNFISNIETVYDVEVEKLEESNLTPEDKVEFLVSQDGVAYEVIGTQDPATYEPSLMVIASPTSDITEIRKK